MRARLAFSVAEIEQRREIFGGRQATYAVSWLPALGDLNDTERMAGELRLPVTPIVPWQEGEQNVRLSRTAHVRINLDRPAAPAGGVQAGSAHGEGAKGVTGMSGQLCYAGGSKLIISNSSGGAMYSSHLKLRNWKNFKGVEADLSLRTFVIGPNAAGKSNLLDVFRFLRDVANDGLRKAVDEERSGISMIRCLAATRYSNVDLEVRLAEKEQSDWTYRLSLNQDNNRRPIVREETVLRGEQVVKPLLLEEPEISLHPEVVRRLPSIFSRINRGRKTPRQIIVSTHSAEMLRDPGIGPEEVLRLEPSPDGTLLRWADAADRQAMQAGLTAADVLMPKAAPENIQQMVLEFP